MPGMRARWRSSTPVRCSFRQSTTYSAKSSSASSLRSMRPIGTTKTPSGPPWSRSIINSMAWKLTPRRSWYATARRFCGRSLRRSAAAVCRGCRGCGSRLLMATVLRPPSIGSRNCVRCKLGRCQGSRWWSMNPLRGWSPMSFRVKMGMRKSVPCSGPCSRPCKPVTSGCRIATFVPVPFCATSRGVARFSSPGSTPGCLTKRSPLSVQPAAWRRGVWPSNGSWSGTRRARRISFGACASSWTNRHETATGSSIC